MKPHKEGNPHLMLYLHHDMTHGRSFDIGMGACGSRVGCLYSVYVRNEDAGCAVCRTEARRVYCLMPMRLITPDASSSHSYLLPTQKEGDIALFGGEFFDSDTDRQLVYGDLFVFNCSKERWRRVVIPHRRER